MKKRTIRKTWNAITDRVSVELGFTDPPQLEVFYNVDPAPLRPQVSTNLTIVRFPDIQDRPRRPLVVFDPDDKRHNRYLVRATEREGFQGTERIEQAMAQVGIEVTAEQAFSALCDHLASIQSSGVEL